MASCKYDKKIDKYFTEELTFGETFELKEHLESCPVCKEKFDSLQGFFANLRRLNDIEKGVQPPADFTYKTLSKLDSATPSYEVTEDQETPYTLPVWKWATGFALAVIFVLSVSLINLTNSRILTVNFELFNPQAKSVCLAGDFNNWNYNQAQLQNHNGIWRISLKLEPGQYQYMFVVDGKVWTTDPKAKESVDDGYGNQNAIIDIL